jgi:hypothetical protein
MRTCHVLGFFQNFHILIYFDIVLMQTEVQASENYYSRLCLVEFRIT